MVFRQLREASQKRKEFNFALIDWYGLGKKEKKDVLSHNPTQLPKRRVDNGLFVQDGGTEGWVYHLALLLADFRQAWVIFRIFISVGVRISEAGPCKSYKPGEWDVRI